MTHSETGETMPNLKTGDRITVTYTGVVSDVTAFGTVWVRVDGHSGEVLLPEGAKVGLVAPGPAPSWVDRDGDVWYLGKNGKYHYSPLSYELDDYYNHNGLTLDRLIQSYGGSPSTHTYDGR